MLPRVHFGRRPPPPAPPPRGGPAPSAPTTQIDGARRDQDGAVPSGPDFRGPIESVLRHPLLAVLPVVLLVAAAVAVGLLREPLYSAEARISVGRTDVPAYTLQEVVLGNATLAASYARAFEAPQVIAAGARAAGISEDEARERVFGSQVPQSTLIRIDAEGESVREARDLANGVAEGLIDYVRVLNVRQQDSRLIERYRRAQRRTDRARRRYQAALRDGSERSRAAEQARLDLLTAQLRSQTLSTRVVQTGATPAQNALQLVVPAASASSDRDSVLGRLVLIALAAGVLLGIALALLRANAGLLRARRERPAGRRG